MALFYHLYVNRTEWSYGGDMQRLYDETKHFCLKMKKAGIQMLVLLEGMRSDASIEKSLHHCHLRHKGVSSLVSHITTSPYGAIPPKGSFITFSPLARQTFVTALRESGVVLRLCPSEPFPFVVHIARTAPCPVIGYDSCYLCHDIPFYIYLDSISFKGDSVSAKMIKPAEFAEKVGLSPVRMPIFSHLLRNDAIPDYMFAEFTARLDIEREAGEDETMRRMLAIVRFIREREALSDEEIFAQVAEAEARAVAQKQKEQLEADVARKAELHEQALQEFEARRQEAEAARAERIAAGEEPGDLPEELATEFEFAEAEEEKAELTPGQEYFLQAPEELIACVREALVEAQEYYRARPLPPTISDSIEGAILPKPFIQGLSQGKISFELLQIIGKHYQTFPPIMEDLDRDSPALVSRLIRKRVYSALFHGSGVEGVLEIVRTGGAYKETRVPMRKASVSLEETIKKPLAQRRREILAVCGFDPSKIGMIRVVPAPFIGFTAALRFLAMYSAAPAHLMLALVESVIVPPKNSTIRSAISSGQIRRDLEALHFLAEYSHAVHALSILNELLLCPLNMSAALTKLSGAHFLFCCEEVAHGRGLLNKFADRVAGADKIEVTPAEKGGFSVVKEKDDKILAQCFQELELARLVMHAAFTKTRCERFLLVGKKVTKGKPAGARKRKPAQKKKAAARAPRFTALDAPN
eukprot:gnl/Chilomastix_cuspidata/505.p1 GENE.gnl/Chilomastix_cuspidata/505~~gnl/Chilomastix_cuspidata/505.p1  ORF type:complete len:746 (-),score=335.43 gnl/Chilomastix_cuspidata/505:43-2136(-)